VVVVIFLFCFCFLTHPLVSKDYNIEGGSVVHACSPSTWKAKAGESYSRPAWAKLGDPVSNFFKKIKFVLLDFPNFEFSSFSFIIDCLLHF
jgi:hypothetical protein